MYIFCLNWFIKCFILRSWILSWGILQMFAVLLNLEEVYQNLPPSLLPVLYPSLFPKQYQLLNEMLYYSGRPTISIQWRRPFIRTILFPCKHFSNYKLTSKQWESVNWQLLFVSLIWKLGKNQNGNKKSSSLYRYIRRWMFFKCYSLLQKETEFLPQTPFFLTHIFATLCKVYCTPIISQTLLSNRTQVKKKSIFFLIFRASLKLHV